MKPSYLAFPFLPLASAIIPGTRVYDEWAGAVPNDVWLSSFRTPNTTGSVSISGFNMTSAYPGTPSGDWRYSIDIVADIPLDAGFISGAWIRLTPPENLFRDLGNGSKVIDRDESWSVCQYLWVSEKVSAVDKVDGDTCEGALDKACYDAIKRQLGTPRNSRVNCASVSAPTECDEAFGRKDGGWDYEGLGLGVFQSNQTDLITDGSFSLMQDSLRNGTIRHEAGNTTAYDLMVKKVYIIGHTWGYDRNFFAESGQSSGIQPARAELACLRAPQPQRSEGGGSSTSDAPLSARRCTGAALFFASVTVMLSTVFS
ncbi:hypothetical protein B0T16DRAFT_455438 [Cercophora newfieldiana]|uniref:Uncharacterized protein n=1 Tax=Cercophora newfieldiana TaxID=92897 RepID=A0AA39YJF3_9PEZI|nr:hypothetical protein B0T16DRAFT_455438 [Cercophora newfieldiana]